MQVFINYCSEDIQRSNAKTEKIVYTSCGRDILIVLLAIIKVLGILQP